MNQENTAPTQVPHGWSVNALLTKAQRYVEEMQKFSHDDWRFAMWSTLALELLARATLAHVSPTLLADPKNWNNVYYALGFQPKVKKFTARSVDISNVLKCLQDILPAFRPELEGSAVLHMSRRNEELHSGITPFDNIASSSWLPDFYETCDILLASIGSSLELFIGKDEAAVATTMIAAARDKSAKAVMGSIHAHKAVWENKEEDEQSKLDAQASAWATRHDGHRVKCPACGSQALVFGVAAAAPIRTISGDQITEAQQYLPSKFECVACGLKISSYSQLNACGLGEMYKATFNYNAAEYYQSSDPYEGFEPDYNEKDEL